MSGSIAPGGSVLAGRNGSAPIGAHSRSRLYPDPAPASVLAEWRAA